MNYEGFEDYLRQSGLRTENEIREVISRISWVETTLEVSLDQLAQDEETMRSFKSRLLEVIGSEEKTEAFYHALWSYYEFQRGLPDGSTPAV
jgi:hypothetical protein